MRHVSLRLPDEDCVVHGDEVDCPVLADDLDLLSLIVRPLLDLDLLHCPVRPLDQRYVISEVGVKDVKVAASACSDCDGDSCD